MVNRTMRPAQALSLVRKLARQKNLTVETRPGRGKGSHSIYAITDNGVEVARFGLTGHRRDLSNAMMRQLEDALTPVFGPRWTEKRP